MNSLPEMFPMEQTTSSRTIFINPNFNKMPPTHINPKFLNPCIHVNPNFLSKEPVQYQHSLPAHPPILSKQVHQQNATVALLPKANAPLLPNKIISKTRTKIVRIPMNAKPISTAATNMTSSGPLIKIGLRKLIRTTTTSEKPKIQGFVSIPSATQTKYKIDRRRLTETNPIRTRKTSFTGRYALRRSSDSLSKRTISKFAKRNPDALSLLRFPVKATSTSSKNRQLQLLNINGVLYKSTRNKLERKDVKNAPQVTNTPKKITGERAIFVRGTKYLLDKTGFNLTRVANTKQSSQQKSLRRIDIGGLTYVANSKNVLVRTDTHLTRNHVSSAKQKSIQMLSRRYVKTNIPCPIYQRVGKCAAFESGKCMKVHDKMHVAICRRFLRGECVNASCLLSHNVSLSKMPVCKFFLQGCCVREDCHYLHKKLSDKAEICMDFLKGFCKLAQKCNKRHEFVCPDMETKGKCEKVKCPYCRKQQIQLTKRKENNSKSSSSVKTTDQIELLADSIEPTVGTRYFATDSADLRDKIQVSASSESQTGDESDQDEEISSANNLPKRRRPQLGELPAFIPFS